MNLVFVESFLGGSHEAFARGWIDHSRHRWRLLSLPAERWKWRLRAGATLLGPRLARLGGPVDAVVVTGLIDVAHLRQLAGRHAEAPFLLYMHENQFHYPRPSGEPLDRGFAMAHLASFLAADAIAWNSRAHRRATIDAVRTWLAEMPAPKPRGILSRLERGGTVLPPGVDLDDFPAPGPRSASRPPVIAWNHRWDGDKRPGAFARTLDRLADRGLDFRLVLLGPVFQVAPKPLVAIRERHGPRILRDGPAESRSEYAAWLARADHSLSTASQENFGYAAVEAMAAGAVPLMPDRLSYPELLSPALARRLLYDTDRELADRLAEHLRADDPELRGRVTAAARAHAWPRRASALDDWVERRAALSRRRPGS